MTSFENPSLRFASLPFSFLICIELAYIVNERRVNGSKFHCRFFSQSWDEELIPKYEAKWINKQMHLHMTNSKSYRDRELERYLCFMGSLMRSFCFLQTKWRDAVGVSVQKLNTLKKCKDDTWHDSKYAYKNVNFCIKIECCFIYICNFFFFLILCRLTENIDFNTCK